MSDLGVDVFRCARHVAGASGLTARVFQRVVNIKGHLPGGGKPAERGLVVKPVAQCQRICGAARDQHLLGGDPARDLRQAHRVARLSGGIHGIGDRKIWIVSQNFGRFRERFFERISRVVFGLYHGLVKPWRRRGGKGKRPDGARYCPVQRWGIWARVSRRA